MQPLLLGAALFGGWFAWKRLKRELARLDRESEADRKPPAQTLEHDPDTGRYRIRRDR